MKTIYTLDPHRVTMPLVKYFAAMGLMVGGMLYGAASMLQPDPAPATVRLAPAPDQSKVARAAAERQADEAKRAEEALRAQHDARPETPASLPDQSLPAPIAALAQPDPASAAAAAVTWPAPAPAAAPPPAAAAPTRQAETPKATPAKAPPKKRIVRKEERTAHRRDGNTRAAMGDDGARLGYDAEPAPPRRGLFFFLAPADDD